MLLQRDGVKDEYWESSEFWLVGGAELQVVDGALVATGAILPCPRHGPVDVGIWFDGDDDEDVEGTSML